MNNESFKISTPGVLVLRQDLGKIFWYKDMKEVAKSLWGVDLNAVMVIDLAKEIYGVEFTEDPICVAINNLSIDEKRALARFVS